MTYRGPPEAPGPGSQILITHSFCRGLLSDLHPDAGFVRGGIRPSAELGPKASLRVQGVTDPAADIRHLLLFCKIRSEERLSDMLELYK